MGACPLVATCSYIDMLSNDSVERCFYSCKYAIIKSNKVKIVKLAAKN